MANENCINQGNCRTPQFLMLLGAGGLVVLGTLFAFFHPGTSWPCPDRHEQPGGLGLAPCLRRVPDRGRLRRAQRRLHRLRVRQAGLQGPGAPVRHAGPGHAGRRPGRAGPGPGSSRSADRGHDPLQLQVHLCLEHALLQRLLRHCRPVPADPDGPQAEGLFQAGGLHRLPVAPGPDHGHGLHLRLPGGARRLQLRPDGAHVHHLLLRLWPGRFHAGADRHVPAGTA
jgi:hypothetical protein